jgi:leucyl/phenylalanyl-tRNA--protein transferase
VTRAPAPAERNGPVEPPPTPWRFPDPRQAEGDIVGIGADLEPGTVLAAYRAGIFPMPSDDLLAWWSPEPRGVLPLDGLRVSRSLRKSLARFDIRVDTAFEDVVAACADPSRAHGWITDDIRAAYTRLHHLGWAHSVEAWSRSTGLLAGGLYGVGIGGLFAGESMFHREADASKAALVGLAERLRAAGAVLLDVQWLTPHLASLGAVEVSRADYLELLAQALAVPARSINGVAG